MGQRSTMGTGGVGLVFSQFASTMSVHGATRKLRPSHLRTAYRFKANLDNGACQLSCRATVADAQGRIALESITMSIVINYSYS